MQRTVIQTAFRACPLTASMPTLEVSQPVVGAVLGVVVLDETLDAGRAGMIALAAAVLVMPSSSSRVSAPPRPAIGSRLNSTTQPA